MSLLCVTSKWLPSAHSSCPLITHSCPRFQSNGPNCRERTVSLTVFCFPHCFAIYSRSGGCRGRGQRAKATEGPRFQQIKRKQTIAEEFHSYIVVKLMNVKSTTIAVRGANPSWEQEFIFETNRLDQGLILELWNKGVLWDKLLGVHFMPLHQVQYAVGAGVGRWVQVDQEIETRNGQTIGTCKPTDHSLLVDVRFELPFGECLLLLFFIRASARLRGPSLRPLAYRSRPHSVLLEMREDKTRNSRPAAVGIDVSFRIKPLELAARPRPVIVGVGGRNLAFGHVRTTRRR